MILHTKPIKAQVGWGTSAISSDTDAIKAVGDMYNAFEQARQQEMEENRRKAEKAKGVAKVAQQGYNAWNENVPLPLRFIPYVDTVDDVAEFTNDVNQGNYGWAAAGLGAMLLPYITTKGIKALRKVPELAEDTKKVFKSDIDWGKWNKEIPKNAELMEEYHDIEKKAKESGTWMKTPYGAPFAGTPEQFVQVNSKNFKKAFPRGYYNMYRGSFAHYPEFRVEPVFTGDRHVAHNYTLYNVNDAPTTVFAPRSDPALYNLAVPKGNDVNIEGMYRDWSGVPLYGSLGEQISDISKRDAWLTNKLKEVEHEGRRLNLLSNKHYNKKAEEHLSKITDEDYRKQQQLIDLLPKKGRSTDAIADVMSEADLDNVLIHHLHDSSNPGTILIHENKPGQFVKSLWGNNGMFDMTNPNIYKSLLGVYLGNRLFDNLRDDRVRRLYGCIWFRGLP